MAGEGKGRRGVLGKLDTARLEKCEIRQPSRITSKRRRAREKEKESFTVMCSFIQAVNNQQHALFLSFPSLSLARRVWVQHPNLVHDGFRDPGQPGLKREASLSVALLFALGSLFCCFL